MKSRMAAPRRRQAGAYVIAIAVLLGIAVTLLTFAAIGDLTRSNASDQRTAQALEQAKQALIGYAATYRDTHPGEVFGYLPCPDIDGSGGEGIAATACGSKDVTVIGRLPYRTLDLPPLRDASGECMWYALSGNVKNNPKTDLMSWDTNGLIEVMQPDGIVFVAGASPTNRAAAVIFSPGPLLTGQDRSLAATNPPTICGGNYNAANYLDTDLASGINNATAPSATPNALSRFIAALDSDRTAPTNDSFNDRLVAILPEEIFARRVNLRADLDPLLIDPSTGMLRLMVDCIVRYGRNNAAGVSDKRLPWAAPMTLSAYGASTGYDDASGTYSGRFPFLANTSAASTNNTAVLSAGGVLLQDSGSQPCLSWAPVDEFWNNWKDQTFYAVAKAFAPNSAVATNSDPCSLDECLTVGGASNIAAVVIFSGRKQTGQSRNNDANPAYASADKANPANFLEGLNTGAIQSNSPGVPPWPRQFVKEGTNDTVMCVAFDTSSGLYAEPTCASTSACTTQGSSLASYRNGNINNCKVGNDDLLPACKTLEDWIHQNNCPCHKAGHEFNNLECLKGFTTTKCINAHASLAAC